MPTSVGPNLSSESSLVYAFDTGDTVNSYLGEPTTNFIPSPYDYSLYAYASGPVNITTTNELGNTITAKRYTITQAINVARAAIFPTSLSTGVAYTFSVKWRYNGTTTTTPTLAMDASKGNPEVGGSNGFTSQTSSVISIGQGWYLSTYTFVFATSPTLGCILTFGISTGATGTYVNETFDVYEAQFEVKDHRTQPVIGTRSVSGSLLDIAGNRLTINSISASYNSSAQLTFNGSSYLFGTATNRLITHTVESVFRPTSHPIYGASVVSDQYSTVVNYKLGYEGVGLMAGGFYDGNWRLTPNITTTLNTWHHVVYTYDGSSLTIYKNGLLGGTNLYTGSPNTNGLSLRIGRRWDNPDYFVGDISIVRIYNRALTADEITNNFNELKSRFNFS